MKTVCRVLLIYVPVPIFWALFDQQGSSWTLQATQMSWQVFGIPILPDQIQLLNPLFILILAPLFGYIVYPMFKKCGILTQYVNFHWFNDCKYIFTFNVIFYAYTRSFQ